MIPLCSSGLSEGLSQVCAPMKIWGLKHHHHHGSPVKNPSGWDFYSGEKSMYLLYWPAPGFHPKNIKAYFFCPCIAKITKKLEITLHLDMIVVRNNVVIYGYLWGKWHKCLYTSLIPVEIHLRRVRRSIVTRFSAFLYTFCSSVCFGKRGNMILSNNDFVQTGKKFQMVYFIPEAKFYLWLWCDIDK